MRTESVVATEFAKADAEHTANVERTQRSANKRSALLVELEEIRSAPEPPQPEPATKADEE